MCGHVLAWCSKNKWAYICPMQILMEDMQRTLPASTVGLPGGGEALASVSSSRTQHSDSTSGGGKLRGGYPDVSGLHLGPAQTQSAERSSGGHASGLMRDDQRDIAPRAGRW